MDTPDDKQQQETTEQPEAGQESAPPSDWIQFPEWDYGDLDGPLPAYGEDLSPQQREEYDAALSERQKRLAGAEPRPSSGARRSG